jgi:hypothetical protein
VADTTSHTIRQIVIATGVVSTVAGSAGVIGSTDATGIAVRFNYPTTVTTDGTNLYVVDTNNNTIRKVVIATGVVTTLAGSAGLSGSTDGTGTAARFNGPMGLATDGTNLYVSDHISNTIRKMVIATGAVTTLAGSAGVIGSTDGTGTAARFYHTVGITTDGTNLYVADYGNHTIRKISANVDSTAPANTTSANFINSGAASTSSTSVTLSLSATDSVGVTGYYASETATAPSASATGWTAVTSTTSYSGSISFTLSSGDGTKTVYVWFKDAAGNVSSSVNDTITLSTTVADTTAPATTVSPAGGTYTSAQSVTLTCADNSGGSGCGKTYYTANGTTPTTASTVYSSAISISSTTTLNSVLLGLECAFLFIYSKINLSPVIVKTV